MDDCIFCMIIAGELPSTKIFENDSVLAIRDIHPHAPVHVLVLPKEHYANVLDALSKQGLIEEMMTAVKVIAEQEGITETGFRLVANNGVHGGQTVNHLHFHLIGGKLLELKMG